MATRQVLFQWFFYTKSFVKHSIEHVTDLQNRRASKQLQDVINLFHCLRHLREERELSMSSNQHLVQTSWVASK
ncbi:hypothetical protein HPG69_008614, partial [Diceros bicornis minor]